MDNKENIWNKIDSKDFEYSLYENEIKSSYKLIIYKVLALGVDIEHILTKKEIENYKTSGIDSLKERMKNMDEKYSDYKVTSWR